MKLDEKINLSIAAPAYNEGDSIQKLIVYWYDYLANHPNILNFEIIICNDGSSDNTALILDDLTKKYQEVKPIHLTKNSGAASALSHAISASQYDWVLLTDSDDQFPIENLNLLLNRMYETHADAIMGSRDKKDHYFSRLGSKMSGHICNWVHNSRLKDFNSAFKLVKGPIVRSLKLESKGMNYSTEITSRLLECRIKIVETDIHHSTRKEGKSKMKMLQGSLHRFLFVCYITFRQILLKFGVLKHPTI